MPRDNTYYLQTAISREKIDQVMTVNKEGTFTIEIWKRGGMKRPRKKHDFKLQAKVGFKEPTKDKRAGPKSSTRGEARGRATADNADEWKVGARIEVYSNSRNTWCPGVIYQVPDDYKVTVQYKVPTGEIQQKTIKKASKSLKLAAPSATKPVKAGPARPPKKSGPSRKGAEKDRKPLDAIWKEVDAGDKKVAAVGRFGTTNDEFRRSATMGVKAKDTALWGKEKAKQKQEDADLETRGPEQRFNARDLVEVWSTKREAWVDGDVCRRLNDGKYEVELIGGQHVKVAPFADKIRARTIQEGDEDNGPAVEVPEPEPEPIDADAFRDNEAVLVYSTKQQNWKEATFLGLNLEGTKYQVALKDGRRVEVDEDRIKSDDGAAGRREEEQRRREEEEARRRQDEKRRRDEDQQREEQEEQRRREDEERRREEEQTRRRQDEDRRRKEDDDRRREEDRRAEEERRRVDEERAQREEDESQRRQKEEESRRRREEEENRRLEEEEERRRRDEEIAEERSRQDAENKRRRDDETAQRQRAEEDRARKDEEDRRRREDETARRHEEDARREEEERRKEERRREDESRREEDTRRKEEDRRRREQEEQDRRDAEAAEENRRRKEAEEERRERSRREEEDRLREEEDARRQAEEDQWQREEEAAAAAQANGNQDADIFDVGQYVEVYSAKNDKWIAATVQDYHDDDRKYVVQLVRNQRTVRIDSHPDRIRAADVGDDVQPEYQSLEPAAGYAAQREAAGYSSSPWRAEYRRRLTALYQRHNPQKADMVDEFLDRYENKEDTLYRKICSQYKSYGVKPEEPPKGYVEEFNVEARVTCAKGLVVRERCDLTEPGNKRIKKLEDGAKLIITERAGNRLHVSRPINGWISEVAKSGTQCVKIMKKM